MPPRPSTAAPILAALAIILLPLAAYVAGYFYLGWRREWISAAVSSTGQQLIDGIERAYPHSWMVTIYQPAGWVEEKCRGIRVEVVSEDTLRGGVP